ncbi:triose-phosphate isomerase [Candidatus Uhrbacteria bacterium]|nr:triose-phosphate isomerase [Candidatus Uhrbacteria bacterium]
MRKTVIANWKMHYGPVKAGAWIRAFRRERLPKDLEIGVAVPFVSLAAARSSLGRAGVPYLGAQDAFWANEGAFTGEIGPAMLKEFALSFCLVGHSERRQHLGETDDMVAKKAISLQKNGIRPVICVGETDAQRKKGETLKVVRAQVAAVLSAGLKVDGAGSPIIAYEPVWAIGTGKACSGQDAKVVHEAIHDMLNKKFGKAASEIPVIYGGSVDARNVGEYLSTTHIDGVLVGSASLDPRAFGMLCRASLPA